MDRQKMIDEVIKNNGFENKWTIWFCELAENINITDFVLQNAMFWAIRMPIVEMIDYNYINNKIKR